LKRAAQLKSSGKQNLLNAAMRLPSAGDGQSVALFGGSFNPPHEGHVHVSEIALQRGYVDQVWWLVSPGNPLKDHSELASLFERVQACQKITRNPRIKITAFEARYGLTYTEQTLRRLLPLRPRVNFIWLMGADNLAGFHKWQNWRRIASMLPIMVVDRPGSTLAYRSAKAAIALSRYRIDESDAPLLPAMAPPAWTFIHGPRLGISSTAIRNKSRI
jgi:nicotinate-nucleotide adenylyltransferase